jgi:hypothetical protein
MTTDESTPRDPAEQHGSALTQTADLVRKLTALADRYEAAIRGADARAADSRQRVALLRAAAQAGSRLIRSDAAAGGLDDLARSYELVTRLDQRALVRQAQGVLMECGGLTAGEAFEALLLAATGPLTLDAVAEHVLRELELPAGQDAAGGSAPAPGQRNGP